MTNQPQEQRVVSGVDAGYAFVKALGLDEQRVTRVLLQAEIGQPLFAHITLLVNEEEVQQVCTFLEPLERLDPINDTAEGNGLWTPR
jgi:hypothetical protein